MLRFAARRDRRETAAANAKAQLNNPETPQVEIERWALDLPEPFAPTEWRIAQLSRRQDTGAPRLQLRHVALVAPLGARLTRGDPASPAAAFGMFQRPDVSRGGAKVVFDAVMPDATDFEHVLSPFPGADYARVQFFVAMPWREPAEATLRLEIEVVGEEATGGRREVRLRLKSQPIA